MARMTSGAAGGMLRVEMSASPAPTRETATTQRSEAETHGVRPTETGCGWAPTGEDENDRGRDGDDEEPHEIGAGGIEQGGDHAEGDHDR